MFINYFADHRRASDLNMAVARILIGVMTLIQLLAIDWTVAAEWPVFFHEQHAFLIPFDGYLEYLQYEAWLALLLVLAFTAGYRTGLTSFLSALLVAHLSGIYFMIHPSGTIQMFLLDVYLLVLFGMYRHTDSMSVDGLRGTFDRSTTRLNDALTREDQDDVALPFFKWLLVIFALTYFFNGAAKIIAGPATEWGTAANIDRYIQIEQARTNRALPWGDFVIQHDLLGFAAASLTLVFETGFVIAVVLGWPITVFALGLMGMHVGIAVTLTPFFWNHFVVFAMFLPWDRLVCKLESSREFRVYYPADDATHLRALQVFRKTDLNDSLTFVPDSRRSESDTATSTTGRSPEIVVRNSSRQWESYEPPQLTGLEA